MSQVTRQLAEFVASTRYDRLPQAVTERARQVVLDHVGIALRARHEAALSPVMARALAAIGLAAGTASVVGDEVRYAPGAAALFNGNLGHALDFDDTHAPASIHCGAPIIPAALAAAEHTGANGERVIAGVVAGFEIQIRLSLALNPSEHYQRGFHPTATCGVFGAAAAVAVVLGLDADQTEDAFGLCGSQAAGSMQFLVDGAWNKPYHTGFAACNGLTAAFMAAEGFRGAAEAIEGRSGFLAAYAPNPDATKATAGLGEVWETLGVAVKPYPSCRYGHAAMDAIIALKAANDIDFRDVESLQIGLPQTGVNIIGEPQQDKRNPSNYVDGQFSMPFVAAVVLRDGAMDWDSYERHLSDSDTLELCQKVTTVADDQVESYYPANMGGVARIRTSKGQFEQLVVVPKGEPENFLSELELRAKFDGLVSPYLSEARRAQLCDALLALHQHTDIAAVMAMTRADQHAVQLRSAGVGDD